ncbi:MAG: hypothetical protein KAY37_16370, partial [Phycisphaerae bacterium]|nr:hypothetical protein [Phycisphaerae bacterium]
MQFVKNHWITLASGLVALVAIAATVYGMTRTSVVDAMNKHVQEARAIESLSKDPTNQQVIEAVKARGNEFDEKYQATLKAAERINEREPLLTGVFPPPPGPWPSDLGFRFREEYQDKIYELPRILQAGGLPTEREIQEEAERMEEEALRKKHEEEEAGDLPLPSPGPQGVAPPPGGGPHGGP